MKNELRPDRWSPTEVMRMLTNLYYTGIRVHPDCTKGDRKDRERVLQLWALEIEHANAETFMRDFLRGLKEGQAWCAGVLRVHPKYCEARDNAIITEEAFVKAAIIQISDVGAERYLRHILDNLEGVAPPYGDLYQSVQEEATE